jgi:hypothetical protein
MVPSKKEDVNAKLSCKEMWVENLPDKFRLKTITRGEKSNSIGRNINQTRESTIWNEVIIQNWWTRDANHQNNGFTSTKVYRKPNNEEWNRNTVLYQDWIIRWKRICRKIWRPNNNTSKNNTLIFAPFLCLENCESNLILPPK